MKKIIIKTVAIVLSVAMGVTTSLTGNAVYSEAAGEVSAAQILENNKTATKDLKIIRSVGERTVSMIDFSALMNISDAAGFLKFMASGGPKYIDSTVYTDGTVDRINNTSKEEITMQTEGVKQTTTMYSDSTKLYINDPDTGKWYFTPSDGGEPDLSSMGISDPTEIAEGILEDIKLSAKLEGTETIAVKDSQNPNKTVECYKITVTDFNLMDTVAPVVGDALGSAAAVAAADGTQMLMDMTYYVGKDDYISYRLDTVIKTSMSAKEFLGIEAIDSSVTLPVFTAKGTSYTDMSAPEVIIPDEVNQAIIVEGYEKNYKNVDYEVVYSKNTPVLRVSSLTKNVKSLSIPSSVKILDKSYKVTSVQAKAFSKGTKTTKITLPKTVTKVGASAFKKCKKLKTLVVKNKALKKKLKTKKGRKSAGIGSKVKIK